MDKVLTSGQFTQSTFSLWLRDGKSGGSTSVTFQLHPFGDDLAISCLLLGSRFISGAPFLRSAAQRLEEEMSESGKQASLLFFWLFELEMRNCETGQASVSGIKGGGKIAVSSFRGFFFWPSSRAWRHIEKRLSS